ncbi:MAG: hypothetical protein V4577_17010 [Bacteroidota bacterium]
MLLTPISNADAVPTETRIYYAKGKLKRMLKVLIGFMIITPIIAFFTYRYFGGAYFLGTFLMVFLVIAYVNTKKRYKNDRPQIIISDEGIGTEKVPFLSWTSISGEDVDFFYEKNNNGEFFIYKYPVGTEKVSIRSLETSRKELKELLKIYRERYNKKHGNS